MINKKQTWIVCSLLFLSFKSLYAEQNIGIIGGFSTDISGYNTPYASLISIKGEVFVLPSLPTGEHASISSVSMNDSGFSIMGGHTGSNGASGGSYTSLVDPFGNVQILESVSGASILGVVINASNNSLIAGGTGSYYQARIDPTGNNITPITIVGAPSGGTTTKAQLNDSNLAVLGGSYSGVAAIAFPNNDQAPTLPPYGVNVNTISINSLGNFIIAGKDQSSPASRLSTYDASGNLIFSSSTSYTAYSAAINDSNLAIIGGIDNDTSYPYASFIDLNGQLIALSGDPLPSSVGIINSVAINSSGYAVIGGSAAGYGAYAALVDPTGFVHTISGLPTDAEASINSVSLNDWGIALLGGTSDGTNGYAMVAAPWTDKTIVLPINAPQVIYSVSIRTFVPTTIPLGFFNLTGNNLIFAEYITNYARKKIRFFIPSVFEGTLPDALESAAPTKNAISVFTAANNYFLLSQALASHLHNYRHSYNKAKYERLVESRSKQALLSSASLDNEQELLPLNALLQPNGEKEQSLDKSKKRSPYYMWLQPIGAYISQKAQNQTVGFNPTVGGLIAAFEPVTTLHGSFGGGAAYSFTHVHEHKGAGSSNINQEYLFFYGTWSNRRWHLDAACWGGFFQTRQTRYIEMEGFNFYASSRPTGTQLSPHLEFGYDRSFGFGKEKKNQWTIDPFVMADWPHTWQKRYKEKGSSPFNATQAAQHSSFLRTEAGIRFYETFVLSSWMFTLEEKGSYVYRHPYQIGTLNAFLVGSPGSFTLETFTSADQLAAVSLSFIFEPLKTLLPSGSISYHAEFGTHYQSHQLSADITWNF